MTALLINSIPVPVTGWRPGTEEVGERGRSFSGRAMHSLRAVKHKWSGSVVCTDPVEAEALRCLLEGEGFVLPFDTDLYSANGLPPITANGATLVGAPAPKFGAKCLSVPANVSVYWQGAKTYPWTLAYWRYESAAWHHYVDRYDGATHLKWKDGVRNDAASTPYAIVNGSAQMVLMGEGAAASYFDDVIWMHCLWPTTWAPLVFARSTAFPGLPWLEVWGDLMPCSTVRYTCRGQAGDGDTTPTGASRIERFEFSLFEE